jgi:hypothetical protein
MNFVKFWLSALVVRSVVSLDLTLKSNASELPYSDWMSYFQDFYIGDLPVIPASHDSATVAVSPSESWSGVVGWLYARTQELSIYNQLLQGIRFLDFRISVTFDAFDRSNTIDLTHTFHSNTSFLTGLREVKRFLDEYPTEVVFVYVRVDTANPLGSIQLTAKKRFIESVMLESGLQFANFSSIATQRVRDLSGKAVLLAQSLKLLPTNSTSIMFIDTNKNYSVCDIWQYNSITYAQKTIAKCFQQVPRPITQTGILTGYALDGFFDPLWQNITSPEMNNWFFTNFQTNPDWARRKQYPLGILMIDFVNATYMSAILDFAMNFAYPYPAAASDRPAWAPGTNKTDVRTSDILRISSVVFLAIALAIP